MKTTFHFLVLPIVFVSMVLCCTSDSTPSASAQKPNLETYNERPQNHMGVGYHPNSDYLSCERNGKPKIMPLAANKDQKENESELHEQSAE